MADFRELWPGGPLFRQSGHFRLGTDSILLADFIAPLSAKRGVDLGCGSGLLSRLLLEKSEKLHMTGLELLEEAAAAARENLAANALETRAEILCGDIRRVKALFPCGAFDLAAANPPYYPLGRGAVSPRPARAAARAEGSCTLDELCEAAAWLCRTGGRFCLVHKPERLSEVFVCLHGHGLEPKRLRLVCPAPGRAPNLALIESRRGGGSGLVIEPPLLLRDEAGRDSEELRRIYRR